MGSAFPTLSSGEGQLTEISCIGLGLMGSALARALLAAGHGVTVWNRSPGKAKALVDLGAKEARSFAEAVAASPVILICIDNYASTRALLEPEGMAGHLAGRTVVSLTTGTPREAEELSVWVAAQGAHYLDGAILCGPSEIVTRGGEVLLSGDAQVWQATGPLLTCLASKVRHVGQRVGAAAGLDFAWLTMSYVQFIGVAHAANICRAQGIDLQAFIDLFPADPAPADVDASTRDLARIIKDANYDHPTATLQVWGEALARIQMQARDAGIPSDIPDFIAGYFQRAVGMGLGQEEAIAIYKTLLVNEKPT
jgi:3-hydroxyisobutyrate dehydrogenase-like beta-hydroxyacid dehydrogenase